MKKNLMLVSAFFVLVFILFGCNSVPPTGKITLAKTQFAPNEEIKINFTTEGKFGTNAWIGIIPSSIPHGDESKNDENDVSYQYFEGVPTGELVFNAPIQPGRFDLRMHTSDDNGIEVTSVSFQVVAPVAVVSLELNKAEFSVGEEVIIKFTAPAEFDEHAWIGIIPSETPHGSEAANDGADLNYGYLGKKTSGELRFTVPEKTGSYDVRMNDSDSDGKEVASKTFVVK